MKKLILSAATFLCMYSFSPLANAQINVPQQNVLHGEGPGIAVAGSSSSNINGVNVPQENVLQGEGPGIAVAGSSTSNINGVNVPQENVMRGAGPGIAVAGSSTSNINGVNVPQEDVMRGAGPGIAVAGSSTSNINGVNVPQENVMRGAGPGIAVAGSSTFNPNIAQQAIQQRIFPGQPIPEQSVPDTFGPQNINPIAPTFPENPMPYGGPGIALPPQAQSILQRIYPNEVPSSVIPNGYNATMSNGDVVYFGPNGEFIGIVNPNGGPIPTFFIPEVIMQYVQIYYPMQQIKGFIVTMDGNYLVWLTDGQRITINPETII